jgi:hypothetical protein
LKTTRLGQHLEKLDIAFLSLKDHLRDRRDGDSPATVRRKETR